MKSTKAQGVVEYALILVMLAVLVIAILAVLKPRDLVTGTVTGVSVNLIGGTQYAIIAVDNRLAVIMPVGTALLVKTGDHCTFSLSNIFTTPSIRGYYDTYTCTPGDSR